MASLKRIRTLFWALTLVGFGLAVLAVVPTLGPAIESVSMPVIEDDLAPTMRRDDEGYTIVDVVVNKRRNCQFVDQSFLLGKPGRYTRLEFTRPGLVPGGPRPLGRQSFGLYRFDTRGAVKGDQIVGVIYYRCHNLWPTTSTFGPWAVPL